MPTEKHKISFEEFIDNDFALIGIVTPIENYKLAYLINKNLGIFFSKEIKDIEIKSKNGNHFFAHFSYNDQNTHTIWHLLENKSTQISTKTNEDSILFDEYSFTKHLLPEFKTVDYLLKIDNYDNRFKLNFLINALQKIKNITTAYTIDNHSIKSTNNLLV